MDEDIEAITCSRCGRDIPGGRTALGSPSTPCPECGSTGRKIAMKPADVAGTGETSFSMKGKTPGKKKPFVEEFDRAEEYHDIARPVRRTRRIDRRNYEYSERVVDVETGEVYHEDAGSLRDHHGHGSAKGQT